MPVRSSTGGLPDRRALDVSLAMLVSAAMALGISLALWPPGSVYWTAVSDAVGLAPTVGLVGAIAVGFGAWFARTAAFGIGSITVGGALGYGLVVSWTVLRSSPTDPRFLVPNGALVVAFVAGGAVWTLATRLLD